MYIRGRGNIPSNGKAMGFANLGPASAADQWYTPAEVDMADVSSAIESATKRKKKLSTILA